MPVALEYMKGRVFFVSYAGSKEELRKFDEKCECLYLGSNQGPAVPHGGSQIRRLALPLGHRDSRYERQVRHSHCPF